MTALSLSLWHSAENSYYSVSFTNTDHHFHRPKKAPKFGLPPFLMTAHVSRFWTHRTIIPMISIFGDSSFEWNMLSFRFITTFRLRFILKNYRIIEQQKQIKIPNQGSADQRDFTRDIGWLFSTDSDWRFESVLMDQIGAEWRHSIGSHRVLQNGKPSDEF